MNLLDNRFIIPLSEFGLPSNLLVRRSFEGHDYMTCEVRGMQIDILVTMLSLVHKFARQYVYYTAFEIWSPKQPIGEEVLGTSRSPELRSSKHVI